MDGWIKATSTITVNVPGGSNMMTISRGSYSYDDISAEGWNINLAQRRPSPGTYTVNGSVQTPILVIVYTDHYSTDDQHVIFVDKNGNPLLVNFGIQGVGADNVYSHIWLPGADYDFTPLFIKYGNG